MKTLFRGIWALILLLFKYAPYILYGTCGFFLYRNDNIIENLISKSLIHYQELELTGNIVKSEIVLYWVLEHFHLFIYLGGIPLIFALGYYIVTRR